MLGDGDDYTIGGSNDAAQAEIFAQAAARDAAAASAKAAADAAKQEQTLGLLALCGLFGLGWYLSRGRR